MQVFIISPDFHECARVLDNKRLWKGVLEADGLLRIIKGERQGYKHHKTTKMWRNYPEALLYYRNCVLQEWLERRLDREPLLIYNKTKKMPPWINDERFLSSHRAALLFKNFDHYSQFGWAEKPKMEYFYPV